MQVCDEVSGQVARSERYSCSGQDLAGRQRAAGRPRSQRRIREPEGVGKSARRGRVTQAKFGEGVEGGSAVGTCFSMRMNRRG
jgi:hypothetical protein